MKITFLKPLFTIVVIFSFSTLYAQIQTSPLNASSIHPFGTTFSPFSKFASIGESGATPGPTITGCDIYGFRSQLALDAAVNIGVQRYSFGPNPGDTAIVPIISTSTNKGLFIVEENSLPVTFNFGCGNLIANFKQSATNNNVFNIYGSATASGGNWTTSDRTLKQNIKPIENEGQRYGFITQEVEEVMPTVVRKSTDIHGNPADYQVMEYDAIIPVLAEAINTQQDIITDLEARLARLEALILKDKAPNNSSASTLMNPSNIQLSQNRPNPSSGSTTIDYTIPEAMKNAQLVVFDLNGKELSSQEIPTGQGTVKINTSQLTTGAYIYAVVVDGRALARKKMIVD